MKMKRYLVLLLAFFLVTCLLPACDANPVPPETGGWVSGLRNDGVFTDEGYYYLSYQNCLCYLDVNNGINVVLCSKVGCPP